MGCVEKPQFISQFTIHFVSYGKTLQIMYITIILESKMLSSDDLISKDEKLRLSHGCLDEVYFKFSLS